VSELVRVVDGGKRNKTHVFLAGESQLVINDVVGSVWGDTERKVSERCCDFCHMLSPTHILDRTENW